MSDSLWWNFVTGEYEQRPTPTTDEEVRDLISQDPSAQALYRARRHMGDTILEAMKNALLACTPVARAPEEGE